MSVIHQENLETFEQKKDIDLKEYLSVIRKRRWVVFFISLIIIVSITTHTFKVRPEYRAVVRLLIDKENPNIVSFDEVLSLDGRSAEYYQTQFKIITSRGVIEKVITQLDLEKEFDELQEREKETKSLSNILSALSESVIQLLTSIFKKDQDQSIVVDKTVPSKIDNPALRKEELLFREIIEPLTVTPIMNSRLVDLEYTGYDPQRITEIVNAIARVYIEQNLENRLYASEDAAVWLDERLTSMQGRVENSERALQIYSKNAGVTSIEDKQKTLDQELSEFNAELIKTTKKRVKLEQKYKNSQNPDLSNSILEIINNALIQNLNKDLSVLRAKQSELEGKYGTKHPKMIQVVLKINQIKEIIAIEVKKIHDSIQNRYQLALIEEQSLKDRLQKLRDESEFLNEKSIRYGVLKREAVSNRQMYELLLKRLKETDLSQGLRTNNIRIIDKAKPPLEPFKPNKKQNILIGIIFGLISGLGLAFLIEYLDNTVKEPDEIAIRFNIPFLGLVGNDINSDKKTSVANPGLTSKIKLIAYRDPESNISESLRTIRTNVIFSADGDKDKVFMVTSSLPKEGKTTVASNLAVVMASLGERVLIIDADLRRPSIHKELNCMKSPGLSSYLIRQKEIDEIIIDTQINNLSVVPSGLTPPNPSELLSHPQMKALLDYAREHYDRVILDTPPVASVTDPIVISRQAHAVLFVIRFGLAPRDAISKSIQQLKLVKANIMGAVLNGVDFSKDSYYYQYYYKHYYHKETDGEKATPS